MDDNIFAATLSHLDVAIGLRRASLIIMSELEENDYTGDTRDALIRAAERINETAGEREAEARALGQLADE